MKALFEFNLPEEDETYEMYRKGPDAVIAIDDILNVFRKHLKYNDKLTEKQTDILESVRTEIMEILNERNLL
jgi:hypothetical protein